MRDRYRVSEEEERLDDHRPAGRQPRRPRTARRGTHPPQSDDVAALYGRARPRRGDDRRGRAAGGRHRALHRPLAEGQVHRPRIRLRGPDLVERHQRRDLRGALRRLAREGRRAPRAARRLRDRRLLRRRPEASALGARRHDAPVPRALREDDVHRARRGRARGFRAGRARAPRAGGRGRPGGGRHADGGLHLPPPDAQGDPDRRHLLRRRDQEVRLHADERPAAARGRDADALLGERLAGRPGRRGLLRPLRHGQDDAFGRSRAVADRGRRARLGRRRRLQLRGRLLRQDDQPLGRGRARDLDGFPQLRHRARERRRRRARQSSTWTTTPRPRTRAPRTSSS